MTVNRIGSNPVATTPATPAAAAPEARATQNTAAPKAPASSFELAADVGHAAQLGTRETVGHTPLPSMTVSNVPGPLDLNSAEAQKAIEATEAYLNSSGTSSLVPGSKHDGFVPASALRDELGMVHVRMQRTFDGVPVFGQQVISHLDASGKVTDLTDPNSQIPGNFSTKADLSGDKAVATALKDFGLKPENAPEAKLTVYQGQDGHYHLAYQVQAKNLSDGQKPQNMNYFVDAHSGKILEKFNSIDSIELPKQQTATPVTVSQSATPNLPIEDLKTVSSTVHFDDDLDLTNATVDVDIDHTYRGDLTVTLTAPDGTKYDLSKRQGGSQDDIKQTFDVSKIFAGHPTTGDWTLSVTDSARRDTGTFNSWKLNLTGNSKVPPPPTPIPTPTPGGTADDTTLYSGKIDVGASQNADGTWSLNDTTRGGGVVTKDAHNKSSASGATDFKDNNNVWGEKGDDPRANSGAVDAQYGAEMTYDFYKNVLGRNSIDDKGEKLINNVHINNNYVNAYWDGTQMNYGDGDGGRTAGPLTGIDIAGHEISHGMTERTAGLVYSGESGGLNEAFSDIFGKGVEWYASQHNSNVKFTWGVGESVWTPNTPGDALRYMDDPTKDGDSVDNYKNYSKQLDVHYSSGIANNAFVLMAQGGKNKTSGLTVDPANSLGMDKALKVMYRAETVYMTPNTTFKQAAQACIKAATDLYGAGSPEVKTVTDAWTAVGCV